MRLLHTSDWHLGLGQGSLTRLADHDLFLDWLVQTIIDQQVEVLVVAGDVFDAVHPPAEAQRQLYGFLARVQSTCLRQVVLVAGNHDSATRLEAPASLLKTLDVHVVGGITTQEESLRRCLVPLGGPEPRAVIAAVPYVHEWRLGLRTTELDAGGVHSAMTTLFTELYARIADLADEMFPGLPLLGTGHLTVGPATAEDAPQAIHQVGLIDTLPASVFDPRYRYVALGHIHRSYPMEEGRVRYSGSPIPCALPEMATPRKVILVDVGEEVTTTALQVPVFRELRRIEGELPAVLKALSEQSTEAPLPPHLHLRIQLDAPCTDLNHQLHEVLQMLPEPRPILAEVREILTTTIDHAAPPTCDLRRMTPTEVFGELCRARGMEAGDELMAAFQTLSQASPESFSHLLGDLEASR